MPGAGLTLQLRFVEAVVREVNPEGRNLLNIVRNLRRHRVPFLRELPIGGDFRGRKAVIITRISVTDGEAKG